MTLAALQRDFRLWLTDAPVDMSRWTQADAGLAVYHNAYRVQLVDCLSDMFAKSRAWLGDDAFTQAARTHIVSTPPHGWTLGDYGEGFDRTLASLYPADPEVAELAWLEWQLGRAFEGADAVAIDPGALAGVDWDMAVLRFLPTLCVGPAATNAGAIWSALSAGEDPPAAERLPEPGGLLVWREAFTPCFRTIEAEEQHALALVMAGESFGALCMTAIAAHGEADGVARAGALLGQWLRDGLIVGIVEPGESPRGV